MRIQHGSPFTCVLKKLENGGRPRPEGDRMMEFHIHAAIRSALGVSSAFFRTTGNLIIPDFTAARSLADKLRGMKKVAGQDSTKLSAGRLNAMGLIDEILHIVIGIYRERVLPDVIERLSSSVVAAIGQAEYDVLLREFSAQFPPREVYRGTAGIDDWLEGRSSIKEGGPSVSNKALAFEELMLLKLANENQAFAPFRFLFDDGLRTSMMMPETIGAKTLYREAFEAIETASRSLPPFGPAGNAVNLIELLRMPAKAAPDSLESQLTWIRENWGASFDEIGLRILKSLDLIREEETPRFPPGPGPVAAYRYSSAPHEYEKFTQDKDWMPSLVLLAKNALVWLHQLSETHGKPIRRLDEIPDQELDTIAARGINGLWLIGIWQRSPASEKIKRYCGNPEAAASAYSLFDYDIAPELGGWEALDSLRSRCLWRGIRLAADMVPNHTGMDSSWVRERPELFIGSDHCPYPGYSFNGPDLSADQSIGLWLEDHYYTKTDAAVVFKRLDRRSGKVRYISHGNDGTGMAWNDTAQIDFLNPEARAAVREKILHVASHFSIIRFDAAMVLAKQHVRRLWYPAPGAGGAIPSRAEHSMPDEAFDKAIPHEFWREVVDECAEKASDTLLLAEAFWMMEGYFTRTLGMHRVYNSAFMNMLKDEKNSLYRLTIRNTQEFDKEILKRFVNFMSNPDEQTAIAQFGSGDKYFGICTMLATMPGMPMIGHGQIEGLTEKYGMEYTKAYRDEKPDLALVARHEKEIFPLLRMRKLFAEVEHFHLFDFITDDGHVDENVFAYSNGRGEEDRVLIFFNNCWKRSAGKIALSCPYTEKGDGGKKRLRTKSIAQALGLDPSPGNFLAARELRSELWHLFRCSDLESKGWNVDLEGYQS
ncbi:MAG: alpha-amylase, partial [Spirochaetae bacterium HGW-Spirochaetae-9]